MDSVYEMKLHDQIHCDNNMTITRVSGGWVYTYFSPVDEASGVCRVSSCFVPMNYEFEES